MARPKKIKVAVVIIIVMGIVVDKLQEDITDSLEETIARQLRDGMHIFDGDEEGASWSGECRAVYDAMEAIADAYDPNNINAFSLEELSENLQDALDNL